MIYKFWYISTEKRVDLFPVLILFRIQYKIFLYSVLKYIFPFIYFENIFNYLWEGGINSYRIKRKIDIIRIELYIIFIPSFQIGNKSVRLVKGYWWWKSNVNYSTRFESSFDYCLHTQLLNDLRISFSIILSNQYASGIKILMVVI